jgi:hypothetical protein
MKKTFLISALALAAASVAMPAAAQGRADVHVAAGGYGQHDRYDDRRDYRDWVSIQRRFDRLDRRIDQGVRNGALTRREAAGLRDEFHALIRLERRYSRDGLSRRERADLDYSFDRLERRIRWERRDDDRRGRGGGRGW